MMIGIDCEFSFDADNEFFLVCAAVTQEDGTTRTWWYDQLEELTAYIKSHKSDIWVAHNVETAEGYMFQSLGLHPTKYRWIDTLMVSRIIHNECALVHKKHDLATCLKRELSIALDEDEKHSNQKICVWDQKCSWEDHLLFVEANKDLLLKYCLSDTAHLVKLAQKMLPSLERSARHYLDKAEPLDPKRRAMYYGFLSSVSSEISWNGIPLSTERVGKLLRNAPAAMTHAQMQFLSKYPDSFRVRGKKLVKNVAKCREYAAEVYGSNPPLTDKKMISLASENTKNHKDMDDFLGDYYNLDKKCRALASFSKSDRQKNWMGMFLPKRGIIRPRLNMLGTQTGRFGSKPSTGFIYTMGKCFRGLIDPPEGYVVVELDYHSEEIGCQCYLSGDKTMAEMYEGPDYYTSIAQRLDPTVKDKHDPKRKKYKVISLMSNYGCGAAHLAEIANIHEDEAKDILKDLKNMFRTYWNYVRKQIDKAETMPLMFSDGFRITNKGGKVTSLGNWPFQGVGALILRKLLVELYKEHIRVVAPIHDAIAFMCPEANWKETSDKVAQIMRNVSKECLGTQVDVGDPEVTFHGIPNCHSEFASREEYESKEPNSYRKEFDKYMMEGVSTEVSADSVNLYVDEEWKTKYE